MRNIALPNKGTVSSEELLPTKMRMKTASFSSADWQGLTLILVPFGTGRFMDLSSRAIRAKEGSELAGYTRMRHSGPMSTVTEIEAAIEKLPPADYRELLAWIEEHQAMVGASEALFAMYDQEEEDHAEGQTR